MSLWDHLKHTNWKYNSLNLAVIWVLWLLASLAIFMPLLKAQRREEGKDVKINVPSSSIHFMVKSISLSMEHMSLTSPYRPSYEMDGSKWVIMMSLQIRHIVLYLTLVIPQTCFDLAITLCVIYDLGCTHIWPICFVPCQSPASPHPCWPATTLLHAQTCMSTITTSILIHHIERTGL